MSPTKTAKAEDLDLVRGIFERIATDLGMIIDREIRIFEPQVGRTRTRVEGQGQIHISFKLAFKVGEETLHGCLLVPLPDALGMAAYLMMVPDEAVEASRGETELDRSTKDAMLEVGNFVAGAVDAVVRGRFADGCSARSEGCQGVRPGVRPSFVYEEGRELIVGRSTAQLHEFPEFELILMLPIIPPAA